jgi:hypothetical protein
MDNPLNPLYNAGGENSTIFGMYANKYTGRQVKRRMRKNVKREA